MQETHVEVPTTRKDQWHKYIVVGFNSIIIAAVLCMTIWVVYFDLYDESWQDLLIETLVVWIVYMPIPVLNLIGVYFVEKGLRKL